MRLADKSVPKKNSAQYGAEGRGGDVGEPFFLSVREGTELALDRFSMGKILLLCDETGYLLAQTFVQNRRVIAMVWSGQEVLGLFALPESVVCVFGVGGREVMRVARYFAEVRKVACLLFPREASLYGVYELQGQIRVNGAACTYPLASAEVYFDRAYLNGYATAYARNLLARLALFEGRALRLLRGAEEDYGELAAATYLSWTEDEESILRASMARAWAERRRERGEGVVLSRLITSPESEWHAYRLLLALYAAFVKKGFARRYSLPHYRARAIRAGLGTEGYVSASIPSVEEYSSRALALERTRKVLVAELAPLLQAMKGNVKSFSLLGGREGTLELSSVQCLPEFAPMGLSAIVRDFGLLEW